MVSANVTWRLPAYKETLDQWVLVSDCLAGEPIIKKKGRKYLIPPVPGDDSPENVARYKAFLQGAVFYNVTARTLRGMIGQIFARPPEIKVPTWLNPVIEDASGLGVHIIQQQKEVAGRVVSHGRAGLLSDFTTAAVEGQSTEAFTGFTLREIAEGKARSTITRYEPEQIINWRYDKGTNKKLRLVVLKETYEDESDLYASVRKVQYRVLRLDESGYYIMQIFRDTFTEAVATFMPLYSTGARMDYIPFEFVGSEDNDPEVDEVTMYPLASLNIAHYNNSANHEETLIMLGQPTLILTGLTEKWAKEVLGNKILLGSRAAIPLPAGASANLLQLQNISAIKDEMEHKERQMVALGARLVEMKTVQRTATEAAQEEVSETSTLSTIADNTSSAYTNALWSCSRFISEQEPGIVCKLNTRFELQTLDPQMITSVINMWLKEAISFAEMRVVLRRGGYTTQTDAKALADIVKEAEDRMLRMPEVNSDPNANNGEDGESGDE